jgi:hypothetical protein
MGKKALKAFIWIFLVLFVLAITILTTVDRSPIEKQDFYTKTLARLEKMPIEESQGEVWLAGWGKANMTPDQPVDLVGYAPRGAYEFVQDSSFVKALTLSNGKSQIAWLNFELLIVHPFLAKSIEEGVKKANLPIDQLNFTATHTHSGMGGYMPGPLGEMAFGGFNEQTVELIVSKSIVALQDAFSNQDSVSISFQKIDARTFVANRFIKDDPIDPFVRQLIFAKKNGEKAIFLTYSAHATTMSSKFMGLSGDYPFYLMQALEANDYDFALFAAGTVGSHRPLSFGNTPDLVAEYAHALDSTIRVHRNPISEIIPQKIGLGRLDISLREPHLRIADNIRIRPWLFNYLLGDTNPHLDITLIGNTLLIASSGELSGVFYEKWEKAAVDKGLNLIITTFNGGYIGYITPDHLYDNHFHEVREMNWYGPGNGEYFDAMIEGIIAKIN